MIASRFKLFLAYHFCFKKLACKKLFYNLLWYGPDSKTLIFFDLLLFKTLELCQALLDMIDSDHSKCIDIY